LKTSTVQVNFSWCQKLSLDRRKFCVSITVLVGCYVYALLATLQGLWQK